MVEARKVELGEILGELTNAFVAGWFDKPEMRRGCQAQDVVEIEGKQYLMALHCVEACVVDSVITPAP
jgi:hypothetical protein